ncbi:MAG TPA: hypothetical protein VE662_05505 [Solirubrobacterales bacterium]|nr:hypothetical protein [Solirubrobacterales bacterium]
MWTIILTDWSSKRSVGGSPSNVAGLKHKGLVLQVPTQCFGETA